MKRIPVILFLAAASVLLFTAFSAFSEQQQRIVRLTRYDGRPITGVSASSGFDVHLIQGGETKVVAEVSEALEQYLDLSLGGDGIVRVALNTRGSLRGITVRNAVLKLTVYLPALTSLTGSGGADFTCRGTFSSDELGISMSGGADLESLDVQTGFLRMNVSGGADANISGRADKLDASISGGADAELNLKCNTANVNVSGGADAELSGEAGVATFTASGGADLDAGQFKVQRLTANASGGGGISAWAVDELRATASSAGSVSYRGNPRLLDNRSSSAGSIRKISD